MINAAFISFARWASSEARKNTNHRAHARDQKGKKKNRRPENQHRNESGLSVGVSHATRFFIFARAVCFANNIRALSNVFRARSCCLSYERVCVQISRMNKERKGNSSHREYKSCDKNFQAFCFVSSFQKACVRLLKN